MKNKFLSKILVVGLMLVSFKAFANDATQYDIFLIPSQQAHNYIKTFDDSLATTGLLEKYKVTPFIKNHPVHATLYLTSFQPKYIPNIENQIQNIADNTKTFDIKTSNLVAGKSGFLMLNLYNSEKLQNLSNTVVTELSKYRNKNYTIPSWVKYYPTKLESFKKYGSPNTFSEFNPHFSILAADLKTAKSMSSFVKDFNKIIKNANLKPTSFKIQAIGFGEVDNNGQVTKILRTYKLSN